MGGMMAAAGADLWPDAQVLVPVPLALDAPLAAALQPAAALAHVVGRRTGLPVEPCCCAAASGRSGRWA